MKQAKTTHNKPCTSFEALTPGQQGVLEAIAIRYNVSVEDRGGLHETNSGDDFFEASAWGIKAMLAAAYAAGQASKA